MKAFCGTLAALALLALGLYFLPAPKIAPAFSVFALLWLSAALISVIAFGRELLLLLRLNRIRTRWRLSGKRPDRRPDAVLSRLTRLRERERYPD